MVKIIHTRPYYLVDGKHHSPYVQVKKLCDKLHGDLIDIRCPEIDNDDIDRLLEVFSRCYNILMPIVVYLDCYYRCDNKVREFIDEYFKNNDFPGRIIVIMGDLIKK